MTSFPWDLLIIDDPLNFENFFDKVKCFSITSAPKLTAAKQASLPIK